jgi:hypothetical protein
LDIRDRVIQNAPTKIIGYEKDFLIFGLIALVFGIVGLAFMWPEATRDRLVRLTANKKLA